MRLIVDTREPWPHPWLEYLPEGWELERGTLETGDIALAALPEGAVVERKTPTDLTQLHWLRTGEIRAGAAPWPLPGPMIVIIEGSLADVPSGSPGGLCQNAIVGSIAACTLG